MERYFPIFSCECHNNLCKESISPSVENNSSSSSSTSRDTTSSGFVEISRKKLENKWKTSGFSHLSM